MATDDLTGTWRMETITQFVFNLALTQNGNTITGTMARTNGDVPVDTEPVDSVLGNANGGITFTRTRPGEFVQVYTGQITGSGNSQSIEGTFTHNGEKDPNGDTWFARFVPTVPLFLPTFTFKGNMEANNNQSHFILELTPIGDTIIGMMTSTDVANEVDRVSGSVKSNGEVQFKRVGIRPTGDNFTQDFTGLYTGQKRPGSIDISMQGTFTHNGEPDPTNSGWFATLSSAIA